MRVEASSGTALAAEVKEQSAGVPEPSVPKPWEPGEYIAFAASMAKQVAQRLSPHEVLVAGLVARFTEELIRLAAGGLDSCRAGQCEHWQWGLVEDLW